MPISRSLHFPDLIYDRAHRSETSNRCTGLFGDILESRRPGQQAHLLPPLVAVHPPGAAWTQLMVDMVDAARLHPRCDGLPREGHRRFLQQIIDAELLSLNNDNTYHISGGNGYTDELPAPGFDPASACARATCGPAPNRKSWRPVSPRDACASSPCSTRSPCWSPSA